MVAAMGGNLNQLARMANTAGQVRPEVTAAAEAAQRAADRLAAAAAAVQTLTPARGLRLKAPGAVSVRSPRGRGSVPGGR